MGLGDELMISGLVRVLQQKDPRKVRVVYERPRWSEVFDHNPRIARLDERGHFQTLMGRVNGLRPYMESKSQTRWKWKDCPPERGELYLTDAEKSFGLSHASQVVIEPNLKGKVTTSNKDWGWERWQELVGLMLKAGITPTQVGSAGARRMESAKFVETKTFREAAAVIGASKAAVLPEGGLHHAAAALGVRAVVIFGGYIGPRQTGYGMHVNLFTGGEPCGWRTPCEHCTEAMAKIKPDEVMERTLEILK